MKYTSWINKMSLRDKASLVGGSDFWHTTPIYGMGIPEIMVSDGPSGLRKERFLGISYPAVCYPSATSLASSWDREAVRKVGESLGDECLASRISVLLAPGINIKRSPLCGRNFEYYSEDPFLAGELSAEYIDGVQSKGVGTSLKHFAVNSTEKARMKADSIVDERALREIYLRGFEIAVKKSKPWTIMCAYNKLNGEYCTEKKYLITTILRDEWGYEGVTVSDWNAVNDRVAALKAGLDLEMPSSGYVSIRRIAKAYRDGILDEADIDRSAERVLEMVEKAVPVLGKKAPEVDLMEKHDCAVEAARGCPVLLKNDENLLPIGHKEKVALIGSMAKNPIVQGHGSAMVNSVVEDTPYLALENDGIDISYAEGYDMGNLGSLDDIHLEEAMRVSENADKVIVFVGSEDKDVCESADRESLDLPCAMNELISKLAAAGRKPIVVVTTGSAVAMPWIDDVSTVLQTTLLGEGFGRALGDILTGEISPSGHLSETYPFSLEDAPCLSDYQPDGNYMVKYRESIFVGYRYYEKVKKPVLFPFGHGLTYTTFEYSELEISKKSISEEDTLTVSFSIKNTGKFEAAEVPQLYIGMGSPSRVYRVEKELKAFDKISLKPGESRKVNFVLDRHAFEYYSNSLDRWVVEGGDYKISIGSSIEDIRLTASVKMDPVNRDFELEADDRETTPHYFEGNIKAVDDLEFNTVLGYDPEVYVPHREDERVDRDTCCVIDAAKCVGGKKTIAVLETVNSLIPGPEWFKIMLHDSALTFPVKRLTTITRGLISDSMVDGFVHYLNSGSLSESLMISLKGIPDTVIDLGKPMLDKLLVKKQRMK